MTSIPHNISQSTFDFDALNDQYIDAPTPQARSYSLPQKQCTICLVMKPLSDFDRNKQGKRGRQSACKPCFKQRRQQLNTRPKLNLPTKQCDTCYETKPLADFGRNRANPDRKQTRCKLCYSQNPWNKKETPEPGQTKECRICREAKLLTEFASDGGSRLRFGVRSVCKVCEVVPRAEYNAAHPYVNGKYPRTYNPQVNRSGKIRKKFNLTMEQYDEMFARQGGVCALCGKPETARTRNKEAVRPFLAIDHCHATGTVRGLLCQNCNMMLGFSKDDPQLLRRAADYLEKYRQ